MQPNSLNVLIAGKSNPNGNLAKLILKSKYLKKLYTTYDYEIENVISIRFNTFKELCEKCKVLQIDLVIVEEEMWILQGIGDVLKKHFINSVAFSGRLTKLAISNLYRRTLLDRYKINIPKKILLPVDFPVLVKANGISHMAKSLQEVGEIRKFLYSQSEELGKSFYIENYIQGEKYILSSLYDGRNLINLTQINLSKELIDAYTDLLHVLLIKEKADFIGIINSELILSNGVLYNTGFNFKFPELDCNIDPLYLFYAAVYQKLDEIELK